MAFLGSYSLAVFSFADPNNAPYPWGHRMAGNSPKQVLQAFLIFDFANRRESTP